MFTIFNRKELTVTFSLEEKARVEEILEANEIPFRCLVSSRSGGLGGSRARFGTMGQNMSLDYEYKIYVLKKDYEQAKACLRG